MTDMAAGAATQGALEADGTIKKEATFDAKHVATSVVYIAGLPLDVTVLQMNVM
jgi:NADP-dependent 3-hydroxy acid dehydrogenase YdfG